MGSFVNRKTLTDVQERYYNFAQDWVRAKLREESGAVIGETEARQEYETYFPLPGESPALMAQKRARRRLAERAMEYSALPFRIWQRQTEIMTGIGVGKSKNKIRKLPLTMEQIRRKYNFGPKD